MPARSSPERLRVRVVDDARPGIDHDPATEGLRDPEHPVLSPAAVGIPPCLADPRRPHDRVAMDRIERPHGGGPREQPRSARQQGREPPRRPVPSAGFGLAAATSSRRRCRDPSRSPSQRGERPSISSSSASRRTTHSLATRSRPRFRASPALSLRGERTTTVPAARGTSTSDALSTTTIGTCSSSRAHARDRTVERTHVARAPHGDHHRHCGSREAQARHFLQHARAAGLRERWPPSFALDCGRPGRFSSGRPV